MRRRLALDGLHLVAPEPVQPPEAELFHIWRVSIANRAPLGESPRYTVVERRDVSSDTLLVLPTSGGGQLLWSAARGGEIAVLGAFAVLDAEGCLLDVDVSDADGRSHVVSIWADGADAKPLGERLSVVPFDADVPLRVVATADADGTIRLSRVPAAGLAPLPPSALADVRRAFDFPL